MITIKVENNNPLSQNFYNQTIAALDLNQLPCTCGRSGCLTRHGSYQRKLQLKEKTVSFTIVRVYCSCCGHTHALLLSLFVPYSQIPLPLQVSAIHSYECGNALRTALAGQCCIDESNLRYVLRSYRRHWRERLRCAGLVLTDLRSLVAGCFDSFSRQFMQIKSTRNLLFLPPT